MTQKVPTEPSVARLCGFDRDGSPIFTRGLLVLPKRCPRCGSPDATELVEVTAMSDSKFTIGGLKWKTLSLNVPHCKPCASAIATASSKRTMQILPTAVPAIVVYIATEDFTYAFLTFLLVFLPVCWFFPPKAGHPKPGASISFAGNEMIVIRSDYKAWLSELQIANS